MTRLLILPKWLWQQLANYWHVNVWHKFITIIVGLVIISGFGMYGIATWYRHSVATQPLRYGVTFIPDYAASLGTNPKDSLDALIGIGVKQLRLVSYWSDSERVKGMYDFNQLDWQFQKAEAAHVKVILTLGLRQPRWPECHIPDWASRQSIDQWQPQLEKYIQTVVNRYKNSPSLESYQLENEFFLKGFGTCTDFSRSRLVSEYKLVKNLDSKHPIIVGRSNNALGFPIGQPQPDEFSISIYKRVWDANLTHRYLEYPFPAWFYGFIAGTQKLILHKDMIVGELQAEAWPANGQTITNTSLAEQNKSLDAKRLQDRFAYGKATGMRDIILWGGEYWYYRLTVLHDPSLWTVAQKEFSSN